MRMDLLASSLCAKVALFATVWCVSWGLLISLSYLLRGPSAAASSLYGFFFASTLMAFVGPPLLYAQRLEAKLRRWFPAGASYVAIISTLVPSLAVGFWAAATVIRHLH